MEKKIYKDKIKFEIKARLTEIKLKEDMINFQEAIEKNVDKYLELTIKEQEIEFESVWVGCFRNDDKDEEKTERDEKFEDLYSVFRMESKTMENKQTIYSLFRNQNFDMDNIIQTLEVEILIRFCGGLHNNAVSDQFIYPWKESRVPLKDMKPYTGKEKFEYLNENSFFLKGERRNRARKTKIQLRFQEWVPSDCYPLVRYCSGHYNHPDIIWNPGKRKQILLLASQLKDPRNFTKSTWKKFIYDISKRVQEFILKGQNISHSIVKEIVDFLCHICKVVNYEINFIEAKLTNAAERTISTYAFAFAFKSLLESKIRKQREDKLNENESKKMNLKYFLQKVENRKLARGNWERKEMRVGDQTIANKFARDFLSAVWRKVYTECEQSIQEEHFDAKTNILSHHNILFLANKKVTEELGNSDRSEI